MSEAEQKRRSIQKCIDSLLHACQCTSNGCVEPSCLKMKQIIEHTKRCPTKPPNCHICKQLVALCCYHAKHCTSANCQVPRCASIKEKLRSQAQSRQSSAMHLQRRRMMAMQQSTMPQPVGNGQAPAPGQQASSQPMAIAPSPVPQAPAAAAAPGGPPHTAAPGAAVSQQEQQQRRMAQLAHIETSLKKYMLEIQKCQAYLQQMSTKHVRSLQHLLDVICAPLSVVLCVPLGVDCQLV